MFGRKQLPVRGKEAFAGIGAGHEIRMRMPVVDLEHLNLAPRAVLVALIAGQSFVRPAGRVDVAAVGVEESEHLIERSIFHHELHEVLYLSQLIGHGSDPPSDAPAKSGAPRR